MTNVAFRRALATDLPAIVSLLADDALGQHREDTRSPLNAGYVEAFRAIDADSNQLLAVAALDQEVIGTLQISFIPGMARRGAWRGQIEAARIAAAHRRSRLGQQMFEWASAQCRARGCNLVQLTTDKERPDAHRFYERFGFVGSHIGYKLML